MLNLLLAALISFTNYNSNISVNTVGQGTDVNKNTMKVSIKVASWLK